MESIPGPGAWFYFKAAANSPWMADFYRDVAEEVCAKLPAGRLLDIGTGPGLLPLSIARKCGALEVSAIDVSHEMVNIAEKNALKAGLSERVHFHYGSAEKIPFASDHFNLVITTLSFHHWARPEECLREVSRVLKEKGELWIYEIKHEPTEENKKEVKRRYGPILAFLVLNFVRAHSSISFRKVEEIRANKGLGFADVDVEDKGMFVKLQLTK